MKFIAEVDGILGDLNLAKDMIVAASEAKQIFKFQVWDENF